jgi:hypothetical protein
MTYIRHSVAPTLLKSGIVRIHSAQRLHPLRKNGAFGLPWFASTSQTDTEPIPATVDQAGATQVAVNWARRYYGLNDLDVLAVEFQVRPTRFWRVTFLARERGQTVHLYAVVLPNGRPVEPTVRDEA